MTVFLPHAARCVGWNTNRTCDVTNSLGAGTISRRDAVSIEETPCYSE
jgi:hypothetical protein